MISEPPLLVSSSEKKVRPGRLQLPVRKSRPGSFFGARDLRAPRRIMAGSPSIASAVRFSVTDEMRSIAGQQSHHGLSIVVTSYLVGAPNQHRYGPTSFAQLAKGEKGASPAACVFRVVDKLRSVSPALCTPNTALLVAHDVAGIPAVKDGVRYHHVEPDVASNSMNRRWEIYARILREYTFDCVCTHIPMRTMPAECMRPTSLRRLAQMLSTRRMSLSYGCRPALRCLRGW